MFSPWLSRAYQGVRYLAYWLRAVDQYSLQAPFIFNFYNEVVLDKRSFHAFEEIENLRASLIKDNREIRIQDLGSGSIASRKLKRPISHIAKYSSSNPKFSQFLYRLILHMQPKNILELGTSLGINTLYMAKANPKTPVITLEGCPSTLEVARLNFEQLGAKNIQATLGNIDTTLPTTLENLSTIDLVYFDANHTKEATIRYFSQCLSKVHAQTIFIFDDIHLSKGMSEAWRNIQNHESVTISMDIFDAGIIFFRKGISKEHYILEF